MTPSDQAATEQDAMARPAASTATANPEELPRALNVLRRQWRIIVATTVVAIAASLLWCALQTPKYVATAALYFRDPAFSQQLFGNSFLVPAQDPTRQAATNAALVSLDTVSRMTARVLGRNETPDDVKHAVSIVPQGQSDIAQVRARDTDPNRAARLANTFAQQFIEFRKAANRATLKDALAVVRTQLRQSPTSGPETQALKSRAEQLQLLESLQTANAELVQVALPPQSASSPRTKRNTVIAGVLGLLAGLGLAFGLARIDRRLRTPTEAAEILGRPLLGSVPESRSLSGASGTGLLSGAEAESFRLLRASLRYFSLGRSVRTVLVTSATPGEGKTTVALNLAVAAAEASERVLLVEADMRRPAVAHRLSEPLGGPGLSAVLSGQSRFEDAVLRAPAGTSAYESADANLFVLTAGAAPPNPTDLLESDAMRSFLSQAQAEFDLIVLDTPPVSVVPDAIPLVQWVDGVIVVARLGKTTRQSMARLREQLGNLGASILGVVANAAASSDGYSYGYYYGEAPDSRDETAPPLAPTK